MEHTRQARPGGRSARVRAAVLDATLEALVEHGPDRLSIAEVARRSGVHETSIYRRWRTRENLVVDAMLANSERAIPIPDTGSVRDDLAELARAVRALLAEPLGLAFARAAAVTVADDTLAAARARFWSARRELAEVIIQRGVARGELPPDANAALALEVLIAPLHLRALLTGQPIDPDLPDQLADLVYRALLKPSPQLGVEMRDGG